MNHCVVGLGELLVVTVNITDWPEISKLAVDVQMMSWAVTVTVAGTIGVSMAVAV